MPRPVTMEKIVHLMGGQTAMGHRLGVSKQRVHQWLYRGAMPAAQAEKVAEATRGRISMKSIPITGEPPGRRKMFSPAAVRAIRQMRESGETMKSIQERFGASAPTIHRVVHRLTPYELEV